MRPLYRGSVGDPVGPGCFYRLRQWSGVPATMPPRELNATAQRPWQRLKRKEESMTEVTEIRLNLFFRSRMQGGIGRRVAYCNY
jgi:hypothetical protein